jgi:asparagine synthase (glutamine-hydrolysing)
MPGIFGIIAPPAERHEEDLERMQAVMSYLPHLRSGRHIDPSLGLYVGWTCAEKSFVDCMPIRNERGDVQAFVGGEPLVGRDVTRGLLREGHHFSPSDASYLVHLYEDLHEKCVEEVNGSFAGCVADSRRGTVSIFCDRYRIGRLYYRQESDRFVFASEAKAILRICPPARELDETALSEFLTYGCTLAERSLFRSVSLLPPAAWWTFSRGEALRKRRYFDVREWEKAGVGDADGGVEEVSGIFRRALGWCSAGGAGIALSLTGGLDTRLILALCDGADCRIPSYTFGGLNGDTVDVALAQRLAGLASLRHTVVRLEPDFLSNLASHAANAVHASDGTTRVSGAHEYFLCSKARAIAPVRVTGNYGSEILRGVDTFKPLQLDSAYFTQDLSAAIIGAQERMRQERDCHPVTFAAFKDIPWRISAGIGAGDAHVQVRTPYLDTAVVRLAYQWGSRPAAFDRLLKQVILAHSTELGEVRTDRGQLLGRPFLSCLSAAASELTFRADYLFSDGMPATLGPLSFLKGWLPWRPHRYLDYRSWWRNQCLEYVVDTLTDVRTRQRPYLASGAAARLANEWLGGSHKVFAEIDIVLSLEVIQREIIEAGERH